MALTLPASPSSPWDSTSTDAPTFTRREVRILNRARRVQRQLDAIAARFDTSTRPAPQAIQQRPAKAPAWLQRLILRRATRTRPQERAAFAVGVAVGVLLTAAVIVALAGVTE